MKITKAEAIRHLWHFGDLRFKLHKGQLKLREVYLNSKDKKLSVWLCARRWGKSYFGAITSLELALRQPGSRSFFATAFQVDAVEIILPLYKQILLDCPQNLAPTWLESKKKFIFPNGSEITVVGLDKNVDKLRGRFQDLIILDEQGFISTDLKNLYSTVLIPLTLKRPGSRIIMISTPPKRKTHAFNYFKNKAIQEGSFQKFTVFDNPMLSSEEIEDYRQEFLSEADWQREALCEDVEDTQNLVIPEFNESFVKETPLPSYPVHHYASMDIGTRDKTFYLRGYYDFPASKLVITHEGSLQGKDMTTASIEELIRKVDDNPPPQFYKRIADNSHPLLLNDLALKGLYFQPVQKNRLEEMVNRLRVLIKEGRLIINPRCTELIQNLSYASWNYKRDQFERDDLIGHQDGLQALIYLAISLDLHTNPIPKNYQLTNSTHFIRDEDKQKSQWEKVFGRRR